MFPCCCYVEVEPEPEPEMEEPFEEEEDKVIEKESLKKIEEDVKYFNELETKVQNSMSKMGQLQENLVKIASLQKKEQERIDREKVEANRTKEMAKMRDEIEKEVREDYERKQKEESEKLAKEEEEEYGELWNPEGTRTGLWIVEKETPIVETPAGQLVNAIENETEVLILETQVQEDVTWGMLASGNWISLDKATLLLQFPVDDYMMRLEMGIYEREHQTEEIGFRSEQKEEMRQNLENSEKERRETSDQLKKSMKNLVLEYEQQRFQKTSELQKLQDLINNEKEIMMAELEEYKIEMENVKDKTKDLQREVIEIHETMDGVKAFHEESLEEMNVEKGRLQSRLTQAQLQSECDRKELDKMSAKKMKLASLTAKIDELEKQVSKKANSKMKRENAKLKKQMRDLFIQNGEGTFLNHENKKLQKQLDLIA